MDARQIDFDRPEPGAEARRGQPGVRRYKDKRSVRLFAENCQLTRGRYVFDRVFGMDASQDMVFEHTAKPLLAGVLDGFNATVFAYGVS